MGLKGSKKLKEAIRFERICAYCEDDRSFVPLLIFLVAVFVIGYLIPAVYFGRPFGTDTYTHIFHAQEMYQTDSLFDFYSELGKKVLNPDLANNLFNYPFGSWLFIAVLAKVTGLGPESTAYVFSAIFLGISAISYYVYTGLFLETRTQKVFALLFLFSMPNVVLTINNYRPSTFVLPFLLLAIYAAYSEEITIKNLFMIGIAVFAIALTHTGSLIYIMIFSITFFWLYCLFGRSFSRPLFAMAVSTFMFFWIAVKLFPHLYDQYATKATLFLTPGNFLAEKFHIFFADDLSAVLYENLFVNHQFVYVIIWSAFVFAVGSVLVSVGDRIVQRFFRVGDKGKFAILPVSDMSHSFLATPFWIGPIHAILSLIGFFRLDLKGKCLAVTVVLTTVVPAMMQESEGVTGPTGALREISYLYLIVPVVAVLGLWYIIPLVQSKLKNSRPVLTVLYIAIFCVVIITPVIGNWYYMPSISGDDYVIDGMEWLSQTGTPGEKVVGYGYRTIPVYTGKMDASYGLASGTQTRTFIELLKGIYFRDSGNQAGDFYSLFGAKYILVSDKLIENLNETDENVTINSRMDLDKIYSSRDLGIHALVDPSRSRDDGYFADNSISMGTVGSNIEIKTKTYKLLVDRETPTIKYIGTTSQNLLQEGAMYDTARITWMGNSDDMGSYFFSEETFTVEEVENQLIYRTILKDDEGIDNWSTLTVVYTFLPEMIKREFIISNDRLTSTETPVMRAFLSTNLFMPASTFILKESYHRDEKTVYPSDDTVHLTDVYEEFYFTGGDTGIYLKYGTTAPFPQYVTYKGSTAYEYCSFGVSNFETIYPGASLHITQYIAIGDENRAQQYIQKGNRISLYPYPDAITPLLLCGYDYDAATILNDDMYPSSFWNTSSKFTDVSRKLRPTVTLDEVFKDKKSRTLYIISVGVPPPYDNILYSEGLRHPQMAQYLGEPTGTVILPESEPRTDILGRLKPPEEFFTDWKGVIRSVAANDDMALFLIRPQDVNDPKYSLKFQDILVYAEGYGLTQAHPDDIARHYSHLQQISYNSSFDLDEATVTVTNRNPVPVNGVTLAIQMPMLEGDVYIVDTGDIRRTAQKGDQTVLYVSVDLQSQQSKTITVRPSLERKHLYVEIPDTLKEGPATFFVWDEGGQPMGNARITINDVPYLTNAGGNVTMELRRGSYELTVEKAGYGKETRNITVGSYFAFLEDMFR